MAPRVLPRMTGKPFAIALGAALFLLAGGARAGTAECIGASERGQALVLQRKLVVARSEFIACASGLCPDIIVKDCTERLAAVDAQIASIVLAARYSDGRSIKRARVSLDGIPLVEQLDGKAMLVEPGEHRFHFELPNGSAVEQTLVIEEGAKWKPVVATFDAPRVSFPVGAIVLAGVGVAALGVMTVFGIQALEQSSNLHALPPTGYTQADVSSLRDKRILADIFLGTGALALGSAAAWVALVYNHRAKGVAREVLLLKPVPRGGALGWRVDF
jgi:hypothetical protein